VRVSVVRALDRLRPTLDHAPPGVTVFASDFPHPEGAPNALEVYAEQLSDVGTEVRDAFYGNSMTELLALGA
jgi:hypothetical protein